MVPTRASTPHVPLQPAEIAAEVARASEVGVTMVHLHARDEQGAPTWRREVYADIISRIREHDAEIVINVSTSGRNWSDMERRSDVLFLEGDLKPDMASLTLSSLNFAGGPSVNSPDHVRELARIMRDRGIVPELEIFDLGMLNFMGVLRREGLLTGVAPVNLFFGNIAGMQPTLSEMGLAVSLLPEGALWNATGLGSFQQISQVLAIHAGGGVRVGLEDGIWRGRSKAELVTNTDLIQQVHDILLLAERSFMAPADYRAAVLAV
jgi:uncharacterized protein (DUF849 family)